MASTIATIFHGNLSFSFRIKCSPNTTTDLGSVTIKNTDNITIIKYGLLKKMFTNISDLQKLHFIRTHSTNQEDYSKAITKQKILNYVLSEYIKTGKKPLSIDVNKATHKDIYTYFNGLFEIYKILKIPPPLRNMGGLRAKNPDKEVINLWKTAFKKSIIDEIEHGRKYPTGVEIAQHFKISNIWNIVKVSELYCELNLNSYRRRGKGSRTITSVQDV